MASRSMSEDSRIQWVEAVLWIEKAVTDVASARGLLNLDLLDPAAFHVQQAVEKVLKGMLVAAAQDIRRTHDIGTLATLARAHWPDLVSNPFPLTAASQWYVTTRYPSLDETSPDRLEIEQSIEAIEQLIAAMRERAPPDVTWPERKP